MRSNYWSNSKIADKIRGINKPVAETSEGWSRWKQIVKNNYPIRYWISETLLDSIQDIIYYIPDLFIKNKNYLLNRYINKSNSLVANKKDIKPGNWCDLSDRILPCLFNSLVDFVEIEKAYLLVISDNKKNIFNYPRYFSSFRSWRSSKAGLEYLDWEISLTYEEDECLDPTNYGKPTIAAKEIKDLYLWWTVSRPNRTDPYEESGWSDYYKNKNYLGKVTEESKIIVQKLRDLEDKYEAEDSEYLHRLIEIRRSLCT
jgi:hypothetical protein